MNVKQFANCIWGRELKERRGLGWGAVEDTAEGIVPQDGSAEVVISDYY